MFQYRSWRVTTNCIEWLAHVKIRNWYFLQATTLLHPPCWWWLFIIFAFRAICLHITIIYSAMIYIYMYVYIYMYIYACVCYISMCFWPMAYVVLYLKLSISATARWSSAWVACDFPCLWLVWCIKTGKRLAHCSGFHWSGGIIRCLAHTNIT